MTRNLAQTKLEREQTNLVKDYSTRAKGIVYCKSISEIEVISGARKLSSNLTG